MTNNTPHPHAAMAAHHRQLSAQPRPTPVAHTDLAAAAAKVRDADDLYRLYRHEWVTVYVVDQTTAEDQSLVEAAHQHYETRFAGRVREADVRFIPGGAGGPYATVALEILLPVMKAEFKHAYQAERFAEDSGFSDWSIVRRNSKADHDLRGYGVKKLPR